MNLNSVLLLSVFSLSGCATVHFDNGEPQKTAMVKKKWHHNVALELVEVSKPIDPAETCEQQWHSVTTQHSYTGFIATGIVSYFMGPASLLTTNLWAPQQIKVECREVTP